MSISIYIAGKIEYDRTRYGLVDCSIHEHEEDLRFTVDIAARPFFFEHQNFLYTGPYTVSNDHGTAHRFEHASYSGSSYGYPIPFELSGASASEKYRRVVLERCRIGICKAELIYAWVNSEDAYGTLAEICFALGLGKRVYVATGPQIGDSTQAWFPLLLANAKYANTPQDGLKAAIREMEYWY